MPVLDELEAVVVLDVAVVLDVVVLEAVAVPLLVVALAPVPLLPPLADVATLPRQLTSAIVPIPSARRYLMGQLYHALRGSRSDAITSWAEPPAPEARSQGAMVVPTRAPPAKYVCVSEAGRMSYVNGCP